MDRYIADSMLGGLARWLRLLGLDVYYDPALTTPRLLKIARREGRVVITRSLRKVMDLPEREYICVFHDDPKHQILEAVESLNLKLDPSRYFTRCLLDNTLLEPKTKDEVKERVPAYVHQNQTDFSYCPTCDRVYWPGTHYQRMLQIVGQLGLPTSDD